jgi:uncharacterized protein YodC (DUF2158 family)
MTIAAGSVVILKSGGQPLTVIAVNGAAAECIWLGEEGDFFRETIPLVALAEIDEVEEDDEQEDESPGEDDAADDEDEAPRPRSRKRA